MVEDITIRRAEASDAGALSAMWASMARQHRAYDQEVWCWSPEARQRWREQFEGVVDSDSHFALVAEAPDGSIAGFTLGEIRDGLPLFTTNRSGFVWDLVVDPSHRRRGLGRRLMERAFDDLRARGVEDVILHVALKNEAAARLYEKLGMRRVMTRMYRRL